MSAFHIKTIFRSLSVFMISSSVVLKTIPNKVLCEMPERKTKKN
jgi:hypothetical protein